MFIHWPAKSDMLHECFYCLFSGTGEIIISQQENAEVTHALNPDPNLDHQRDPRIAGW